MQKIIDASGMQIITETGIYSNLDAGHYHSQLTPEPSLSSSMARMLVNECPAMLHASSYLNPAHKREERAHFDIGQAVQPNRHTPAELPQLWTMLFLFYRTALAVFTSQKSIRSFAFNPWSRLSEASSPL